jgi:hypothetical protein
MEITMHEARVPGRISDEEAREMFAYHVEQLERLRIHIGDGGYDELSGPDVNDILTRLDASVLSRQIKKAFDRGTGTPQEKARALLDFYEREVHRMRQTM